MSNTTLLLEPENTLRALKAQINADLLREAEPSVQAALKAIEAVMRERLAANLIKLIDKTYSVQRNGTDLVIHVKREDS